jgi:outer membrane protein OmpA-like peptidoglycan-associated protein
MKRTTLPILAGFSLLLASGNALADESLRQVWHDSEDQIVHNTWGTCVRSRWDVNGDPCAPPAVVVYQPPPAPRTIIAEADRTVYFPFNVASLTPDSQQKLSELAQRINSASDIQSAQVIGYADRIGTTSYNEALSKKRAETVRDYLIGHNVITQQETMTRWVGKSESNTQCPGKLTHEQLTQCLSPDRKASVELKYKQVVEQPQAGAAPRGPLMGQPPLAPTAAAHVLTPENSNAVVPPAPYPIDRGTNNSSVRVYPLEQSSLDQPVQVMSLPQSSVEQPVLQQQSSAADMQSAAPPEPQPDSASPTAYEMQDVPNAGQYAQTEYQAEYPPPDHPADQPSDEYRERYLTTGE